MLFDPPLTVEWKPVAALREPPAMVARSPAVLPRPPPIAPKFPVTWLGKAGSPPPPIATPTALVVALFALDPKMTLQTARS